MENYLIRPAVKNDQNSIIRLFMSFMHEIRSQNPGIDFTSYVEQAIKSELSKLDSYYLQKTRNGFFVAELEAQVIGTVGFEERNNFVAELRRLMVSTEHRRKGIATKLVQTVESSCYELNFSQIILETSELQSASIALYEGLKYLREPELISKTEAHKGVAGIRRYLFRKKISRKVV